ncbi:recombinase family protein [Vibrio parahaemolyticus]|nr:recombinase family protein [Vibrio parahaemolyticus]MDN4712567.1 recombinase family protein [Vibrio parahaemolyticus]
MTSDGAFSRIYRLWRKWDTLVITRLDRLARSVVHLAQLAKRFEKEKST